ncbi:MAG: MarR family winged helix-turn-helix transcriptional regulator [Bifidobacteriaceae bacterium]|nr:MarR family winged helix-turn-helix transcriptional regulator [Bifidobacteriaceae bacterium]
MKIDSPVLQMQVLSKRIWRYLRLTLPDSARRSTGGNMRVLMFLAHHPDREVYQRDIEDAFGITRSTASRELSLLEANGMIDRLAVARDARLKRLVLTDRGRAVVDDLNANAAAMERRVFDGFSADDIDRFTHYLHRMRANIERAMPPGAGLEPEEHDDSTTPDEPRVM